MAVVTVTGGTGYIGRALIEQLIASGHTVTALARPQSRGKVPAGATIVEGSPLQSEDVARALSPGGTLVLLVGAAAFIGPRPIAAQAPSPFRGGVQVVNVTATVSDSSGRFVPGLKIGRAHV